MLIDIIVNRVFDSNTYILTTEDDNYCWLVDIGDFDSVLDVIGTKSIQGIFITHTHYDHIYGLLAVLERFPECVIYTSEEGRYGLAYDKYNFSRYHGTPIIYEGPNIRVLMDGESVEIFDGVTMYAMLTPGHDKSCVTYYTDDCSFTGDSFIPGFEVITTFPRSNKLDSEISLKKIQVLLETRTIYPGHKK